MKVEESSMKSLSVEMLEKLYKRASLLFACFKGFFLQNQQVNHKDPLQHRVS